MAAHRWVVGALLALCLILRLPRLDGPLDLRFDAGVYYVLGTSLAQGKGYRILSEPGEIHGMTYPPFLPALAAAHQLVLGTSDPDVVGHALRLSYALLFTAYVLAVFWMASVYLPWGYALVAAVIVALHFRTNFHADYFIAELPFALVATLLFGIVGPSDPRALSPRRDALRWTIGAGVLALAGFFLRTAGMTLFAVWVLESLRRRQWRQSLMRAGVAIAAVLSWQSYLSSVKRGPDYTAPSYAYQRAPYQFYNVPYTESMWLVDLFNPEAGVATVKDLPARILSETGDLALGLGASVSIKRGWYEGEIAKINRVVGRPLLPNWTADALLLGLTALITAGLLLLVSRGAWLIPCYVAMTIALFLVYPAPGSLERYLASMTPVSVVALLLPLVWLRGRLAGANPPWRIGRFAVPLLLAAMLAQEAHTLRKTHRLLYHPAEWVDGRGRRGTYLLYAYDRPWRLHSEALAWLRRHASPGEVIATSTPHWAFLKTGLKSVQPPWEPDAGTADQLLETANAKYLVIDQLVAYEQAGINQRYTLPLVKAFPERWELIYAASDSGSRIYRRVGRPMGDSRAQTR